jgi:hypothetical protein
VRTGETFRVRLACNRVTSDGDGGSNVEVHWFREQTLRTSESGQGVRLPFRFEVPSEVPGTRPSTRKDKREFRWRVEATATDHKGAAVQGFDFHLNSASGDPMEPVPKGGMDDPDEPQMAALGPELAPIRQLMEDRGVKMTPEMQMKLAELTPDQRAAAINVMRWAPKAKKFVIWGIVAFVAIQVIFGIIAVIAAISGGSS